MTTLVGGIRIRLIHDNLFYVVRDGLEDLGWLDSSTNHKDVVVRDSQIGHLEKVEPNIVSITVEDDTEDPAEMGSLLTDHTWTFYIDIYAENDQLGLHLGTDIKDILAGRFTQTVSRCGPNISIYDLTTTHATPVELFSVAVEGLAINKSRFFEKPYQEHWRVVSFTVTDTYMSEED